MEIRQANLNDLNLILEYFGNKTINRKDWHIEYGKFIKSYIKNKHNFFLIALKDKKVVGTINGELWDDKGFAYVGEISANGKEKEHIIKNMFKHFKKFCKKKGVSLINTYVNIKEKEKIKVYQDLKMKKIGKYFGMERRI